MNQTEPEEKKAVYSVPVVRGVISRKQRKDKYGNLRVMGEQQQRAAVEGIRAAEQAKPVNGLRLKKKNF